MKRICLPALLLAAGAACCTSDTQVIPWDYQNVGDVLPPAEPAGARLLVDIYLDATTSMEGYATSSQSVYSRFLNGIEAVALTGFRNADVKQYKFGTTVKPISRQAYLTAREREEGFYQDPDTYQETHIDSVINRTDPTRLSVVITDLFQRDNDINTIVQKIKVRCFEKGVYLGMVAVPSQFDGMVYDAHVPPYAYRSTEGAPATYRPFYALFFGHPANITQLLAQLEARQYVQPGQALIISPYLVRSYTARMHPDLGGDFALVKNADQRPEDLDKPIRLKGDRRKTTIPLEIEYELMAHAPEFAPGRLEVRAYRRTGAQEPTRDSTVTQDLAIADVRIADVRGSKGKVTATLLCSFPPAANWYSYKGYLTLARVGGLKLPGWVSRFSSENPTSTRDANKTLNLEKFVADLLQASLSVRQPNIAKFYLTVRRAS